MALATQCPFCQTSFRVAQDQLKLRGGLVRCGNCKEVFNGNDHLVTSEVAQQLVATPAPQGTPTATAWPPLPNPTHTESPTAGADAPSAPSTPAWLAPANLSATFASIAADTNDAPWGTTSEAPVTTSAAPSRDNPAIVPPDAANINTLTQELSFPIPQTSSAPQVAASNNEDDAAEVAAEAAAIEQALNALATETTKAAPVGLLKQATREDVTDAVTQDETAQDAEQTTVPEEDTDGEHAADDDDQATLDDDAPSFVQRAERRERLGRVVRVVMIIGVILLSITLPLQALYLWRNQVAAWLPSTQPLLSSLCAKLHCTVGLPTNIEQLSLESNELQLLPPNQSIYTLTVLLRNRGAAAQSWPYLELTLNDNDEKAITRRAFTPREYLASEQQVNGGFAGNSEQQVKMTFELNQPVAAGYRVYLFFP